jgi:putative ATP-dependent endonuclease of OLD family
MEFLAAAAKPKPSSLAVAQPMVIEEREEVSLSWNEGSVPPSTPSPDDGGSTAGDVNQEGQNRPVQVILTTHSPNLSSKIALDNLVLMHGRKAYSLGKQHTKLDEGDYRFLARFLDVTKANLFFARGLLVVEGDAEAILLPALAKLLGRDLTRHGVSVVNVGGVGLGRYARILQRAHPEHGTLRVPVACISDMDVMPDCAPQILGLVEDDDDPKWQDRRRKWRAFRDFGADDETRLDRLAAWRSSRKANDDQNVQTFVAEHWTLEYDLAYSGMARELLVAARLAAKDDAIHAGREIHDQVIERAMTEYERLRTSGMSTAQICSTIYDLLHHKTASKAITAQYLVDILEQRFPTIVVSPEDLEEQIPGYLIDAITYVTSRLELTPSQHQPPQQQT